MGARSSGGILCIGHPPVDLDAPLESGFTNPSKSIWLWSDMASHPISPPSSLPPTVLKWTVITLSDVGPNAWTPQVSFTFPRCMEADPLTSVGPKGWEPDGKASWWPYFQERHKLSPLFWVQGHMLNQIVHGRGTPMNLV